MTGSHSKLKWMDMQTKATYAYVYAGGLLMCVFVCVFLCVWVHFEYPCVRQCFAAGFFLHEQRVWESLNFCH